MALIGNAVIKKINGNKVLNTHNINIYDYKYIESFYSDVLYYLEDKYLGLSCTVLDLKFKEVVFNDIINLYELGGNGFLLEYKDEFKRNDDYRIFSDNYKMVGKRSLLLKGCIHFPSVGGYFNFNDKFYSIVDGENILTKEISSIIYKGVIINPLEYLK